MKLSEQTKQAFDEVYLKQSVISNILMLIDYLPQYSYTYEELIYYSLDNLEAIRDNMIPEYNQVVKNK